MSRPPPPRLAIVVPVLDEAQALPTLLQALQPLRARGCELVVADGGSRDCTWLRYSSTRERAQYRSTPSSNST